MSTQSNHLTDRKLELVSAMTKTIPTVAQLQRGLKIREQIAALEAELSAIFGGSAPSEKAVEKPEGRKRSKMSAAGRARIAAAQKLRWANTKKGTPQEEKPQAAKASGAPKASGAAKASRKGKRTMSPETKAKLAAAMTRRWAARKAS